MVTILTRPGSTSIGASATLDNINKEAREIEEAEKREETAALAELTAGLGVGLGAAHPCPRPAGSSSEASCGAGATYRGADAASALASTQTPYFATASWCLPTCS